MLLGAEGFEKGKFTNQAKTEGKTLFTLHHVYAAGQYMSFMAVPELNYVHYCCISNSNQITMVMAMLLYCCGNHDAHTQAALLVDMLSTNYPKSK